MIELIRSNNWSKDFAKIKAYLVTELDNVDIEHIGSTAVPNLLAKPIIDIDVIIDDINQMPEINKKLELLGYRLEGDLGVIGRYAYLNNKENLPQHHLYLCLRDQKGYIEHKVFKNYLLNHPDKCREYENLKLSISSLDSNAYCQGKTAFINICLQDAGYQADIYEMLYPNFTNSIINLTASIQKHFGFKSSFTTLPYLDSIIGDSKHIVLLVLDGMGINILLHHLKTNAFLRKHYQATITSVFPPTTVAATTVLQSGVLPGESGWIGWQQYFSELDCNVVLFNNVDYYTNEMVNDNNIKKNLNYVPFANNFEHSYQLFPHFKTEGFSEFNLLCDRIIEITNLNEVNYTYAYWDKPDSLIHKFGCYHPIIKETLETINDNLERISKELGKDTTLIITADHGLIDVKEIHLNKFTEITKYFIHKPGIEGRAMTFYVKKKEEFKTIFNKYFHSYFDLYSRDEFINMELIGKVTAKARKYIGDYIAIAKREFYFNPKLEPGEFLATHAGITKDEMLVPLIVYKS